MSLPNRSYFITVCTAGRRTCLATDDAASVVFEELLFHERERQWMELIAVVTMPDHVHVLLRLGDQVGLEHLMKSLRARCAQRLNRMLGRTGSLWARGYFEHRLRVDDDLAALLNYLWHNPAIPGTHFRCRREIWEWFRCCIAPDRSVPSWLEAQRPGDA